MESNTSRPLTNKLMALVSVLSALLLVAIIYIVILESQNDQTESSETNQVANQQELRSPATTENKNSSVSNINETPVAVDNLKNTVNEERIVNQEGNFSYILPDDITQDDLWINIASIYEVKALDGPCSAFDEQTSQNNNGFFQNSRINEDVSQKLQKSLPGAIKAEMKQNSYNTKYIEVIDICNGMTEPNEIANALKFWAVIYQNNQEILIEYNVPQSTFSQSSIKVKDLELLANQLWVGQSIHQDIQNRFNKFKELAESIKFGNN